MVVGGGGGARTKVKREDTKGHTNKLRREKVNQIIDS